MNPTKARLTTAWLALNGCAALAWLCVAGSVSAVVFELWFLAFGQSTVESVLKSMGLSLTSLISAFVFFVLHRILQHLQSIEAILCKGTGEATNPEFEPSAGTHNPK